MNELTRKALSQIPEALKEEAERLFHNNELFWLLYTDTENEQDLIKLFYAGRAVKPLFHTGVEAIEYAISGVSGKIHVDYADHASHHTNHVRELGNQRNYGNHFNHSK